MPKPCPEYFLASLSFYNDLKSENNFENVCLSYIITEYDLNILQESFRMRRFRSRFPRQFLNVKIIQTTNDLWFDAQILFRWLLQSSLTPLESL